MKYTDEKLQEIAEEISKELIRQYLIKYDFDAFKKYKNNFCKLIFSYLVKLNDSNNSI